MKNVSARMNLATMIAATLGALGGRMAWSEPVTPKMHRYVPMMVTASPEEIAAWNAKVEARNLRRPTKHHRKLRGDTGQHPKFPKARVHKEHKHPLRDEHGAFCLVGKRYDIDGIHPTSREVVLTGWVDGEQFGYTVQRKWLGGISAQRGY